MKNWLDCMPVTLKEPRHSPPQTGLLEAFQEINRNVATSGQQVQRYITPLSKLQQKTLALLDFPENIYTRLATISQKSALNMTEPRVIM